MILVSLQSFIWLLDFVLLKIKYLDTPAQTTLCAKFQQQKLLTQTVTWNPTSYFTGMTTNHTTHYLHSIIDENEDLRLRVSKLGEIQKYVEALLLKCQELNEENQSLLTSKQYLMSELKGAERQLKQMSQRQSDQIQMVVLEHDSIMKGMQQELKMIKLEAQREIALNEQLKTAKIKLQQLNEQLNTTVQLQDTEFQKEVAMLRNDCLQAQKQYQMLAKEHQEFRSSSLNQKQSLMQEIYHLKAVTCRQQKRVIQQLQDENQSLCEENAGLKSYNEDISRNSALREKQLRQNVQLLKNQYDLKSNLLNRELEALQMDLSGRVQEVEKLKHEGNLLIDQNIAKKRQLQNSCANAERLCFLLEESDKENLNLREKLKQLDSYIETETEQYKSQYFDQKSHNSQLRKILNEKELTLNEKLREIKDLLNIIDELEASLKLKDKQTKLLHGDLKVSEQRCKALLKEHENNIFQIRSLQQKNKAGRLSVDDIEISNNMLKKELMDLQSINHNLRRQLNNPRVISKEAQQKIQSISLHYQKEKQRLVKEQQIEKDRIRDMHQMEIRQKEAEFLRKVEYFQGELDRIRK